MKDFIYEFNSKNMTQYSLDNYEYIMNKDENLERLSL